MQLHETKLKTLLIPRGARAFKINWPSLSAIAFLHLLSLFIFVPWLFDWRSIILAGIATPFFGSSINLCYHRQLAHRSFETPVWLERILVVIALCNLQDTPLPWVSNHRCHHANTDREEDLHSPLVSFFWSHCGWLFLKNKNIGGFLYYKRYANDLLSDPWYLKLENGHKRELVYFGHAALFFLAGAMVGFFSTHSYSEAIRLGLSFLVWAVVFRTVAIWHLTWSVNSVCHRFGYRLYDTPDHSKNNFLVGILAGGEGWHNNHHASPAAATTQRKWWEFDIIFMVIRLLEIMDLAWNISLPKEHTFRSDHQDDGDDRELRRKV